jgi:hypothetical protein
MLIPTDKERHRQRQDACILTIFGYFVIEYSVSQSLFSVDLGVVKRLDVDLSLYTDQSASMCIFIARSAPHHAAKWMWICIVTNHYSWTNPCKAAHTTNARLRHETLHVFTIYGFNARMCVMQEYSDRDRDCEYVFERMLM